MANFEITTLSPQDVEVQVLSSEVASAIGGGNTAQPTAPAPGADFVQTFQVFGSITAGLKAFGQGMGYLPPDPPPKPASGVVFGTIVL
ncbi:hypothetical protein IFO70_30345 [Phormidium tenue FACHB-886]|nr:hypothetical protein [Phormidium tenue FACHB-886]